MVNAAIARAMTTDEFQELADEEGVTRELIDGVLVERPKTTRSRKHSRAMTRISKMLDNWLDEQSTTVGVVASGEVRCRLAQDPDLIVGIDVVYYEGEEAAGQDDERSYFDGPPIVAVEILSPSDKHEDVVEKIHCYLSTGTKQVWIADPDLRTITVYRSDADATLYNANQDLPGDPELPGFRAAVKELFIQK